MLFEVDLYLRLVVLDIFTVSHRKHLDYAGIQECTEQYYFSYIPLLRTAAEQLIDTAKI